MLNNLSEFWSRQDEKQRKMYIIGGVIGSAAASDTRPGMEYSVKFLDGSTTTLRHYSHSFQPIHTSHP